MRPAGKARRVRIPGVFERGATQPGGMQLRPNAAGLLPRAARPGDGRAWLDQLEMKSATDPHATTAPWRLLEGYEPVEGVYDETLAAEGQVRPHFEPLIRSLEGLGRQELTSRWDNAKRAIRTNGVTYNVYGDPEGANRSWELDMMPLVISAAEWSHLERALIQRTRLLNLILADVYGPQRLLRHGLLPPALLFANPAFLRPCHGMAVPRDLRLHLHGVDLARSADGQWCVLADRAQAPSGAGYAREK